jgi:3,4-dihydroxy 2-butanone 4-phosphate synthase / GTP cyclohydrolase II
MTTREMTARLAPTEEIIADIRVGRMVILVDDDDRENEGDVIIAADHVTPEAINFMATHARGLICLTITEARGRQLGLEPMVRDNNSPYNTAFTASIEAAEGVTTGTSAPDRARTVRAAVARDASAADIVQPGHMFPIVARNGGVLVRAGHTEAGCDLCSLAGLEPAAVICEVLKDDGSMARLPDLIPFADRHGLKVGAIADLIHFRSQNETLIERKLSKPVVSKYGEFLLHAYADLTTNDIHLVLSKGTIRPERETLVRVHDPLSILDFLDPASCQHTFSLDQAQRALSRVEAGVIILLRRPETSDQVLKQLGDLASLRRSRPEWDPRMYGIGAQILRDLGVGKMQLLASPRRLPNMAGFGLEVTGYQSIVE